jgi:hypothetical protein
MYSLHAIKIKIVNSQLQSGDVLEFRVTNPFIYKRENDENSKAQCEQRLSKSLICIVLMMDKKSETGLLFDERAQTNVAQVSIASPSKKKTTFQWVLGPHECGRDYPPPRDMRGAGLDPYPARG